MRDRTLDAHGVDVAASLSASPSPRPDTVDVACWTPLDDDRQSGHRDTSDPDVDPMATLLADPSTPGDAGSAVAHTLVFEVEGPVRSIRIDYGPLDAAVTPEQAVRVRTETDRSLDVGWRVTADGGLVVRFADPPTADALFVEYGVTRNPASGRHTVDVVVDGERTVEARLVVLG